jgi:hypothetical protein
MLRFYRLRNGLYTPFVRPPEKLKFSVGAKRPKMPQDETTHLDLRSNPFLQHQHPVALQQSILGGFVLPFSARVPNMLVVSNSQQVPSNWRWRIFASFSLFGGR